jgi:hypothetical protein
MLAGLMSTMLNDWSVISMCHKLILKPVRKRGLNHGKRVFDTTMKKCTKSSPSIRSLNLACGGNRLMLVGPSLKL